MKKMLRDEILGTIRAGGVGCQPVYSAIAAAARWAGRRSRLRRGWEGLCAGAGGNCQGPIANSHPPSDDWREPISNRPEQGESDHEPTHWARAEGESAGAEQCEYRQELEVVTREESKPQCHGDE